MGSKEVSTICIAWTDGIPRGGVNLRRAEELLEHDVHAAQHLGHEKVVAGLVEGGL